MTYHVQFLLLVRQPLFDRAALPLTQSHTGHDGDFREAIRRKEALIVVKPDTLVLWHRKGFRLFWRWKSRPKGRPTLPEELKN